MEVGGSFGLFNRKKGRFYSSPILRMGIEQRFRTFIKMFS